MQRLLLPAARARCTQPLLSKFSCPPRALDARSRCCRSFPPFPPLGEPAKLFVPRVRRTKELAVDSCHTAEIEEMGPHRSRQSVVSSNKRPRVGTALPLTAACSGSRFWRALGPPGDQSGDRLGSVGMRGLTPRGKDAPCATDSRTTYYETPAATTRSDRDTRRGPRTRVLAVITRRSAHCSLLRTHKPGSPLLPCLGHTPMPLASPSTHCSTAQTWPPKLHEPVPNISRSRISRPQRVHL